MKIRLFILSLVCFFILSSCNAIDFINPPSATTTPTQDSGVINILPNPSLSSSLVPTVQPTQIELGQQALFAGEYDQALQYFQTAFDQSSNNDVKAQSLLGIGKTYFSEQSCSSAMDAFNRILGQYPSTSSIASAYFFLGQCYGILNDFPHAKDSYNHYLQLRPGILDEFVYELQGKIAFSTANYQDAITAYQAALQSTPSGDKFSLNMKIGQAYAAIGDHTTAIQMFQTIYDDKDSNVYSKASADLLMGQSYLSLTMNNDAYTKLMDAVIQFPRAYDSYTALTILQNHAVPVNGLLSGIVEYYAGQYDRAIKDFNIYLSNKPNDDGTVYYYKGLSHYFSNQGQDAILAYDQMIDNFPDNRFWASAWDEKAYVQWEVLGEFTNAANTLLSFVARVPKATEAAGYLFEAGRIFERNDDLENAANTWLRLIDEYPNYENSLQALFLAGITKYRLGKFDEALTIFRRNAVLTENQDDKTADYLWIGKCYQAKNDIDNARSYWQQAQRIDPTNYYSIRAGELLDGTLPLTITNTVDLGYDLNYERSEAESWMRANFKIDNGVDLVGLGDLSTDPRMVRGQELWGLGLYELASTEFEATQKEFSTDPVKTYRLLNYFYSIGLYRPAINGCRNLLNLAGMNDLSSLSAPIYFTHIRFGAYFRPEVVKATADEKINPLVFYALLRQESLFEPFITSSAGAHGLAQIMPATGKEISDQLGLPPNYTSTDLNRANIAIIFGTHYLGEQLNYLKGDLLAALAAYNAGAGNAQIWKDLSKNDPDLFIEIIRLEETRTYLKQIIEFTNVYQLIYTRPL